MAGGTAVRAGRATWQLDPAHSSIEFSVKHMMMTTVRGRFKHVTATLTGDESEARACAVVAEIDVASIDTGAPDRDAHLQSPDFFDAQRFPKIAFRSTRIEGDPEGSEGSRFRVIGDLTIRDTTTEVTLECVLEGRGQDPWGKERVGFSATASIDRREWGLKWNRAIETGGVLVANRVHIELEVQFVRQDE
jgi:polyisoprenoid-binding protein YceI